MYYNYLSGEEYSKSNWHNKEINNDDHFLHILVRCIEDNNLGYYIYKETYSMSGDWHTTSENYYNKSGDIYFTFWKMHGFQGDNPVTLEKRLYFKNHKIFKSIKNIKSENKKNTQKIYDIEINDKDIEIDLKLKETIYFKLWKK